MIIVATIRAGKIVRALAFIPLNKQEPADPRLSKKSEFMEPENSPFLPGNLEASHSATEVPPWFN